MPGYTKKTGEAYQSSAMAMVLVARNTVGFGMMA